MLIETTTTFPNNDDASDSLAGLKTLPGFIFGYVRSNSNGSADVVTIFDCVDHTTTNLRRQKVVSVTASKDDQLLQDTDGVLRAFAEMDREDCDLAETACMRGTASDLTIITSNDFRKAANLTQQLSARLKSTQV